MLLEFFQRDASVLRANDLTDEDKRFVTSNWPKVVLPADVVMNTRRFLYWQGYEPRESGKHEVWTRTAR